MRNTVLYIAMSLDGFIADENGKVDWLELESDVDTYSTFIKNVDTVLMGWNTYNQVVNELSTIWPYEDLMSYVFTHRECNATDNIQFINKNVEELIRQLKVTNGKDIWICGGANLVSQCVKENLIDEYYITILPILLGKGIRLFGNEYNQIPLKLKRMTSYHNVIEMVYEKRENDV